MSLFRQLTVGGRGRLTTEEIHSEDLLVELEAHFWVLDTDHSVVKLSQQRISR